MIIEMREKDGKQWLYIKAAIEEITGTKFGNTTMKNRYARMKANFVVFEMEHVCLFMFLAVGTRLIMRCNSTGVDSLGCQERC